MMLPGAEKESSFFRAIALDPHAPYVYVDDKVLPLQLACFADNDVEFVEDYTSFMRTLCTCNQYHLGLSLFEYEKWHDGDTNVSLEDLASCLPDQQYSLPWIENKEERDKVIKKLTKRKKKAIDNINCCLAFACYKFKYSDFSGKNNDFVIIKDEDLSIECRSRTQYHVSLTPSSERAFHCEPISIRNIPSYGYCSTILECGSWEPCCIQLLFKAHMKPLDRNFPHDQSVWNGCHFIDNRLQCFEELMQVSFLCKLLAKIGKNNYSLSAITTECTKSDIEQLLTCIWYLFDFTMDLPEFHILSILYDQLKEIVSDDNIKEMSKL